MYFAHFSENQHASETWSQSSAFSIIVISVVAAVLMLGIYWLLKKFTSWKFPVNNEEKK